MKKMYQEILKDLPPDKLGELNDELHEVMCKSIIGLLQDSIAGPGISRQQIETATGVAEVMPDTEAAKELLGFLDSKEAQEALTKGASEWK
jgi:hypothetical protein